MENEKFNRCTWCGTDPLYIAYHDQEWGVPIHNDQKFFEFLVLESAQAGLSWITILKKRENYRQAFEQFNSEKIAEYNAQKIEELLSNAGIIRNRRKIEATIHNARAFLAIQQEFGSFNAYIWRFVGGAPKQNHWKSGSEVPTVTEEALMMSKNLQQRGFRFLGPTICYAFMQATGMVNDHPVDCFRYPEV